VASGRGFYSWSCYKHAIAATNSGFSSYSTNSGITIKVAFEEFLANAWAKPPLKVPWALKWIEDCDGVACGTNCGGNKIFNW
jgi:hypothetical protein